MKNSSSKLVGGAIVGAAIVGFFAVGALAVGSLAVQKDRIDELSTGHLSISPPNGGGLVKMELPRTAGVA